MNDFIPKEQLATLHSQRSGVRYPHGDPVASSPLPGQVEARFDHTAQAPLQRPQDAVDATGQLAARGILKSYRKGPIGIPVLQGIDLVAQEGEFLAIIGQSGCGKSTLLHLLGTLDEPDAGEIYFEGNRIDNLPNSARDILRNRHFGMIFQFYHLLPELTALENVLTPAYISEGVLGYWRRRKMYRARAQELLQLVGLEHRMHHKPRELSGGEMQRTAIARALLTQPRVLFADEPTGNLDRATGEHVMHILRQLNEQQKLTIVMVTHDSWIAQQADRVVSLVEGRIQAPTSGSRIAGWVGNSAKRLVAYGSGNAR